VAVDVRRVVRYPPEGFLHALPVDLAAGTNKVADYAGFEPYVLVLQGLSFSRVDGVSFSANVDGYTDVVKLADLGSARGLDFEEDVKVPVTKAATLLLTATTATSGFPWRHRVLVFRPTVAMKLQLGLRLSPDEQELAVKYDLQRLLSLETPKPFDLAYGVEEWREVAVKLTSSGTVVRVAVPRGKKVVLAGVATERPTAPASAYLTVVRDGTEVMRLDLYCLPSLGYLAPLRVVSLDALEAELSAAAVGTYRVRLVYGIGRLTVREKVMWRLDLTAAERAVAEAEDLYERVEVGIS